MTPDRVIVTLVGLAFVVGMVWFFWLKKARGTGAIGGIKSLNQDNLFTIKWLSYYKKGEIVC
jgi:hypothetical protein